MLFSSGTERLDELEDMVGEPKTYSRCNSIILGLILSTEGINRTEDFEIASSFFEAQRS